MTEESPPASTEIGDVEDVTGVVGSVSGDANIIGSNVYNQYYVEPAEPRAYRSPKRTRRDRRRLLTPDDWYVPPAGLPELVGVLTEQRVVLLTGPVEAGLPSAAWYLVGELARGLDASGRELVAEDIALDEELPLADHLDQSDQAGVALVADLVGGRQASIEALGDQLGAFVDTLMARDSYLVATLPSERHEEFATAFPGRVYCIGEPPAPVEVFTKHLAGTLAEPLGPSCAREPWLASQLDGAWPPRAAYLARLVVEAQQAEGNDATAVVRYVKQLDEDWSGELRGVFRDNADGSWRALLVAAAALEGAPSDLVVAAAEELMESAEYVPEVDVPRLERRGVAERLSTLQKVSYDPDTRRFGRPRFGLSVLEYVWLEHPDLREALVAWFRRFAVSTLVRAPRDTIEAFTDRLVDLSVKQGAEIVLRVVDGWTTTGAPLARSMAIRTLGHAAVERRIGWLVRRRLYDWSYYGRHNPTRKQVVAQVCGGELGARYPKLALVRLRRLSVPPDGAPTAAVIDSVTRIGTAIGFPVLLHEIVATSQGKAGRLLDVVSSVLRTFDHDTWLNTASEQDERMVTEFWRLALTVQSPEAVCDLVGAWLECALVTSAVHAPTMVRLLVDAVHGDDEDFRRLGALSYAAARWPVAGTRNAETGDERLDAVRGLLRTRLDEVDPLVAWPSRR